MRVQNGLRQINEEGCEVTIQNMAPFPWHFGGQRYQNIFADPQEIIEFCSINERRITLDTAHLSMYCKHANINFYEALERLIPYTAHLHMSDASGLNGEGVEMGSGDVDFVKVLSEIRTDQSFIVETWQGHKNRGQGFFRDLFYLLEREKK